MSTGLCVIPLLFLPKFLSFFSIHPKITLRGKIMFISSSLKRHSTPTDTLSQRFLRIKTPGWGWRQETFQFIFSFLTYHDSTRTPCEAVLYVSEGMLHPTVTLSPLSHLFPSKEIVVSLTVDAKLALGVVVSEWLCVSLCYPHDGLGTCLACPLPLIHYQLRLALAPTIWPWTG